MMRRTGSIGIRRLVLALICAAPPFGMAAAKPVDVALVLAVDVSESIDSEEAKLQRQGYIDAIANSGIIHAIAKGKHGRIAVAYFEWADAANHSLIVDWTTIQDEASARAFGARLQQAKILEGHFTSISSAIYYALGLFERLPFETERRVIDISGDGRNNHGPPLEAARAATIEKGVTVNGLPIVNSGDQRYTGLPHDHIERYYRQHVIAGANAFIVVAKNFNDFERAISRKLMREIVSAEPDRKVAATPER